MLVFESFHIHVHVLFHFHFLAFLLLQVRMLYIEIPANMMAEYAGLADVPDEFMTAGPFFEAIGITITIIIVEVEAVTPIKIAPIEEEASPALLWLSQEAHFSIIAAGLHLAGLGRMRTGVDCGLPGRCEGSPQQ